MKAIIVSEKDFEEEFLKCLNILNIKRFEESFDNPDLRVKIENVHRAFVYEIHNLKNGLMGN